MPQSQQIPAEAVDALKGGQEVQFQDPPDYVAAERSYRRAIEFAPDWGEPFHWLASVLQEQNRLEDACTMERRAIELLPSDSRPLIALGWTLRLLGKYAEAAPFIENGLELKPHYGEADARFMLAEIYEHLGEINKAATLWRQIMTMDSTYPSYDKPMEEAKIKLAEHGLAISLNP